MMSRKKSVAAIATSKDVAVAVAASEVEAVAAAVSVVMSKSEAVAKAAAVSIVMSKSEAVAVAAAVSVPLRTLWTLTDSHRLSQTLWGVCTEETHGHP